MLKNTSPIETIQRKVRDYAVEHGLVPANRRLLLAVSGGVDSVVMLDIWQALAAEFGLNLWVAHLNHNLRGDLALRDAEFARRLGLSRGLPVEVGSRDVAGFARERGLGVEEAARVLRYDFLHETARKHDCGHVALAHHMGDQAESILLNLARGTGLTGLEGMLPKRDDGIVRPLLCLNKSEIEDYATKAHLDFVFDHTNDCIDFQRNRVRHVLLPELANHFNPQIVEAICRLGEIAQSENQWADGEARAWLDKHAAKTEEGLALDTMELAVLPLALSRRVLRQALLCVKGDMRRLGMSHIEQMLALLRAESGKSLHLPNRVLVQKDAGRLRITQKAETLRAIQQSREMQSYKFIIEAGQSLDMPVAGLKLNCAKITKYYEPDAANTLQNTAVFAINKLIMPLYVRNVRLRDVISLPNVNGHVPVKKIFTATKVSVLQRASWPVLTDADGKILWIIGLRKSSLAQKDAAKGDFLVFEALPYR